MKIETEKGVVNTKEVIIEETTLSSGIYFVKMETEKGSLVTKIIKE